MSNDLKPSPHLGGFTLLKGKLQPGQCAECAVVHPPEQPHNQQSLHYQYAFREKHGRWPVWHDAMQHCTPEVQQQWTAALAERGVVVEPFKEATADHLARGDSSRKVPRASFATRWVPGAALLTDADGSVSITNDAEAVVAHVIPQLDAPSDRILYKDTTGQWDELMHNGQEFTGFAPISDNDRARFDLR